MQVQILPDRLLIFYFCRTGPTGRGAELRPQRFLVRIQGAALSSFLSGSVAQQIERLFTKQQAAGANPAGATFFFLIFWNVNLTSVGDSLLKRSRGNPCRLGSMTSAFRHFDRHRPNSFCGACAGMSAFCVGHSTDAAGMPARSTDATPAPSKCIHDPVVQRFRTLGFLPGNTGSNPVRVAFFSPSTHDGPKLRQRSRRLLTGRAGCMSPWADFFYFASCSRGDFPF